MLFVSFACNHCRLDRLMITITMDNKANNMPTNAAKPFPCKITVGSSNLTFLIAAETGLAKVSVLFMNTGAATVESENSIKSIC